MMNITTILVKQFNYIMNYHDFRFQIEKEPIRTEMINYLSNYYQNMAEAEEHIGKGSIGSQRIDMYNSEIGNLENTLNQDDRGVSNKNGNNYNRD